MKQITLALLFFLCIKKAVAQTGDCSIEVKGFENNSGKCTVYLFKEKKGFPTDFKYAVASTTGAIVNGKCTISLNNIDFGTYAIVAHHDENGNNKLDKNFIGMPKEGVGTSNNAKSSFGPPSFSDSRIMINKNIFSISITLKYL